MQHTHKPDVPPSRVKKPVAEEVGGIYIVNPHLLSLKPVLIDNALYRATRNQKLFESTRVKFVKGIESAYLSDSLRHLFR